ncbi:MAG: nucleotidyltransferase domain-containing protein [Dysgonomonas sp.]|nr:nucleotidyltransferase domain-containing protein [Dysgonomonas sp.]
MSNFLEIARQNQKRAYEVIEESEIVKLWESIGAKVNLIGSLKTGLLMKHKDIDFHIYTPELKIADDFKIMTQLAEHPAISQIQYINLIDTEEACIEWHAWYKDVDGDVWQIDMIHILEGSRYDGFFENMTERVNREATEEQKETILKLKYETPDDEKVIGVEYYQAVLRDGIKTYADFMEWRKANPLDAIVENVFE